MTKRQDMKRILKNKTVIAHKFKVFLTQVSLLSKIGMMKKLIEL